MSDDGNDGHGQHYSFASGDCSKIIAMICISLFILWDSVNCLQTPLIKVDGFSYLRCEMLNFSTIFAHQ